MKPIEIALKEYTTHDILGPKSNPRILSYFHDIGHTWVKDDDTAWCSAFVNWVLKQAKIKGTGKLNARSFLEWGKETTTPEIGDVVILWRVALNSIFGHVGFFVSETKTEVYILGGNQTDQVCIQAYPKSKILGYRKAL